MNARPDFARYAVRHPDGRWLYHLPKTDPNSTLAVLADGQPMTQVGTTTWWATDRQVDRITVQTRTAPKPVRYILRDPDTASVKYPAELSLEEWAQRREANNGLIPESLWDLYRTITAEQPPTETHIDGPFTVLDGAEPPTTSGRTWHVNLIDSITQRPEYAHLFPGYLDGLDEYVHKLIEKMPRVRFNFNGYQGRTGLHVTLDVPFEQPVTKWQANISARTGNKLKSGRTVPVTARRELVLPVPRRVTGNNYAEALAEWDRQVAFWTDLVTEANVAACNHCRGTGHVPTGAEQYTAKR